MKEKKKVLIKVSYLIDLEGHEIDNDHGLLENIIDKISIDQKLILDKGEFDMRWEMTSNIVLDPRNMNCGMCSKCRSWVTDIEKENHIDGLGYGVIVEGQLLCDICLPPDHSYTF